jgi:hypothetical protein
MKASLTAIYLAAILLPSIAPAADTNTYSNPALGISITKPGTWMFLTTNQHAENLKRATLKDAELMKRLREHPTPPLVGMLKYPEPFDDVNPNVRITVAEGYTPSIDLSQVLNLLVVSRQTNFDSFRVIVSPTNTTLFGRSAAFTKFYYDLKVPDGRRFPDWEEIWLVPHKDRIFIIVLELRQDEKSGTRSEFDHILKSLKLE